MVRGRSYENLSFLYTKISRSTVVQFSTNNFFDLTLNMKVHYPLTLSYAFKPVFLICLVFTHFLSKKIVSVVWLRDNFGRIDLHASGFPLKTAGITKQYYKVTESEKYTLTPLLNHSKCALRTNLKHN